MRTKLTIAVLAVVASLGGAGLWFLILENRSAQERSEMFFGSMKKYPTSGGEEMKIEW